MGDGGVQWQQILHAGFWVWRRLNFSVGVWAEKCLTEVIRCVNLHHCPCCQHFWLLLKVHTKSPTVVNLRVTNNFPTIDLQLESWMVCWVPRIPWSGSSRRSAARWESNWRSGQKTAGQYFLFHHISSLFEHLFTQLCCELKSTCVGTQSLSFPVIFLAPLFIPSVGWTSMSLVHEASSIQAVWTEYVNILHTAFQSDLFSC